MRRYVVQRALLGVPTALLAATLIFVLMRLLPGNVALFLLEDYATPEAVAAITQQLGLDQPLHVQYMNWLGRTASLDMGTTFVDKRPVAGYLERALPISLNLAVMTLIVTLAIAVPAGVLSAVRQDTWVDYVVRPLSILGISIPTFWLGIVLLLFIALFLRWMPSLGYVPPWVDPWTNFQQMFLPSLALGYSYAGIVARMTRSSVLEVLRQDYVRTARAKGLREWLVVLRHALRNALLPVVTVAGAQFAHVLGGAVVVERVFHLPGLGLLMIQGFERRDHPVVEATILISVVFVVIVNLLVDLVYGWLDPRIGYTK